MLVLIQIIFAITYLLSIAIVVLSKKKKYLLQDFANRWFLTLLWYLWTENTNYFDSIRMALLHLIIIIILKRITPLLYVLLEITISRENSPSALITQGTPGRLLNSLIWCKNMSKDVINHNGSSVSDPSVIAEAFKNYFTNVATNLSWLQYSSYKYLPVEFPRSTCEKFIFLPPLW